MESHRMYVSLPEMNSEAVANDNSFSNIVWSALGTTAMFMVLMFIVTCIRILIKGQKTRSPQQRRMYAGSRARPSLSTHEPTIYVSPSNLPPPPKYECMAPPSYEEVVGIHYPNYQAQQPIAQPIATALAQTTQPTSTNDTRTNDSVNRSNDNTVVVTVNERATVTSS